MNPEMIDKIQKKWAKLSSHALQTMKDDLNELVAMIEAAYGCTRSRAEREYHEFRQANRPVRAFARPAVASRIR